MKLRRSLLGLLVVLSAAWGALFWGTAGEVAKAVTFSLAIWLAGGALLWSIALVIGRRRPLTRMLFAVPWLVALLLFEGLGLFAVLRERPIDAGERAYLTYFDGMIGCYEKHPGLSAIQREASAAAERQDWQRAERAMRRHRDTLEDLRICLGELADTGRADVDAAGTALADAVAMRVVADDFYVDGFARRDADVLDRGDEHFERANAAIRDAVVRVHRLGWSHDRWVRARMDEDRLLELAAEARAP